MGTPIVTATATSGESAAIQPAAATSSAPFEAVLAMLTPAIPPSGVPASPDAAALAPVAPATDPVGFGTVALPSIPPANPDSGAALVASPPLSRGMVNAADGAENDLAALLAATAVAGRGVTARAPRPAGGAEPQPLEVAPEDFIGPMRPNGLTAEPAAPAHLAAELPVAAAASVPDVPADFIGPILPPEHRSAALGPEMVPPPAVPADNADATNLELASMFRLEPVDASEEIAGEADSAEPARLPEAEALLQPESEDLEQEQPKLTIMASPQNVSADMVTPPVLMAAAVTSAALKDRGADESAALDRTAPRSARSSEDVLFKAPEQRALRDPAVAIDLNTPLVSDAFRADDDVRAPEADGDDAKRDQKDVAVIADPALDLASEAAALVSLIVQQTSNTAPVHDRLAAEQDTSGVPYEALQGKGTSSAIPAQLHALPARDAAMLAAMSTAAPEKPADRTRSRVDTRMPAAAPQQTAQVETAERFPAPQRPAQPVDEASLPSARASWRETLAQISQPIARSETALTETTTRQTLEPHLAAMVRSVEIVNGNGAMQDAPVNSAAIAPIPSMQQTETASREAPVIANVSAEGRRDTQRDAEIRERQIKQQVLVALRTGTPELRMQLYPPGLGQVMIRLALDGQKLRLSMKAENTDAKDALMTAEAGLRDALSRDGFSLAGFDVHDDERRGGNRRETPQHIAPVSNHDAGEGEAFSVDMTA